MTLHIPIPARNPRATADLLARILGAGEQDASMSQRGPQPMPWEVQIRHAGRTPEARAARCRAFFQPELCAGMFGAPLG